MSAFEDALTQFLELYERAGYSAHKAIDASLDVQKDSSTGTRAVGTFLAQAVRAKNPRLTFSEAKKQAFLSNAIDIQNGASVVSTLAALRYEIGRIDAATPSDPRSSAPAPFIRPGGSTNAAAGGLQRSAVAGVAGDARINYAFQNQQKAQDAREQSKREALTSLKMADVLKINEDNRPLPMALRQSRSLYHGGVSSGFQDPITNPFSKFVYKAKADQYYVVPTESFNSFRRQKARQTMIDLAMKEKLMYPLADEQLSKKIAPKGNLPEEGNYFAKAFRPSNLFIRNGETALKAAHRRYYKLPRRKKVFTKTPKTYSKGKKFGNRVINYMKSNESFKIQDIQQGDAFKPFASPRIIQ